MLRPCKFNQPLLILSALTVLPNFLFRKRFRKFVAFFSSLLCASSTYYSSPPRKYYTCTVCLNEVTQCFVMLC